MIALDANEIQNETVKEIALDREFKIAANLEELTGADMIISPITFPLNTKELINMHLEAGACLYQVKRGFDLAASVGDRLITSIAKMRELKSNQSQRLLLFIGVLTENEGESIIDNRDVKTYVPISNYWAIKTSIAAWNDRGGCFDTLTSMDLFGEWAIRREKQLIDYRTRPSVYSYERVALTEVSPNDPLQIPVRVTNGKVILASINGIGIEKANALYEEAGGHTAYALDALCDINSNRKKPSGIGFGITMKARNQLGLKLDRDTYETLQVIAEDYDPKMKKFLIDRGLIKSEVGKEKEIFRGKVNDDKKKSPPPSAKKGERK